ncbi:MAG: hypothetical protein WKG07_29660 [Hymenobacter sp.]
MTLAESDISGLDVASDNFNEPRQKTKLPALDYNHLHFTDLVLNTHNLAYSANRTTAQVDNLAGKREERLPHRLWRANVIYDLGASAPGQPRPDYAPHPHPAHAGHWLPEPKWPERPRQLAKMRAGRRPAQRTPGLPRHPVPGAEPGRHAALQHGAQPVAAHQRAGEWAGGRFDHS